MGCMLSQQKAKVAQWRAVRNHSVKRIPTRRKHTSRSTRSKPQCTHTHSVRKIKNAQVNKPITRAIYRPTEKDPIFGESHEDIMNSHVSRQKRSITNTNFLAFTKTNIIDSMARKLGYPVCEYIYDKIYKHNLMRKFNMVSMNKNKLLNFAFEYGLYDMFQYLYEHEHAMFDPTLISNYNIRMVSDGSIGVAATSGLTDNVLCRADVIDIHTPDSQKCIRYFQSMKKYSRYVHTFKKFYYIYAEN